MHTLEQALLFLGRHLFLVFGLLALAGAAVMVFSRHAVHSVMGFLFAMLALAGCYLTLHAEFLGVAQLLIYAGGIVVLFLFVVMLVELTKFKEQHLFHRLQALLGVAAVLGLAGLFLVVFRQTLFGPASPEALVLRPDVAQGLDVAKQNAQAVSRGLFTGYLLPFEILSVVLLVALVGAVVLAKRERA